MRLALEGIGMMDQPVGGMDVAMVEQVITLCPEKSRRTRWGAMDRFLRWAMPRDGVRLVPTQLQDKHAKPKILAPREQSV